MMSSMGRIRSEQSQVFNSIIPWVFINMMYHFFRRKVSPQEFFHNKSMFQNTLLFSAKRVIGGINIPVTVACFSSSIFPLRMFFSFLKTTRVWFRQTFCSSVPCGYSLCTVVVTFARTVLSLFSAPWRNFKNGFAYRAFNFYGSYDSFFASFCSAHFFLHIKKALFGVLRETVTFQHLLRAFIIKKSVSLSTLSIPNFY